MNEQINKITYWLSRALDVLFLYNPQRTSLGIILGCVLLFLTILFKPILNRITFLDFSNAPRWGWILLGVLIIHIPSLKSFIVKKPIGGETIDAALELIKKAPINAEEKRQQYRILITKVLDNLILNQPVQEEINNNERQIT
jgi:hypothetical protein